MRRHLARRLRPDLVAGQSSQDKLAGSAPLQWRIFSFQYPVSATGVARSQRRSMRHRSRAQAADLVLDLQFSLLEAADGIVIGMRSGIFLDDRMLQRSMLGFQRFDVVHSAHMRPPCWLRTSKNLPPYMRRVTPKRTPSRLLHK